jgi:N-carbamoylputrescine amidase
MIKVALVQHACQVEAAANLEHISRQITAAATKGAQLVLLQELHNSLYFCVQEQPENFDLAETIPGPTTEHFAQLAREHDLVIVSSLFEKRAAGLYHNTAVVVDSDGSIAGKYRKMHIPDDPGYFEKFYFTPGDLGFEPIVTSLGKLGVLICWDQWYPEAARLMALKGADLLLYPTAIGWDPNDSDDEQQRQLNAWINIQRSHAIANNLHLLSCNRIGFEADPSQQTAGSRFWGHSFVCDPQGEIIVQSNDQEEAVLIAEIDLHKTEKTRRIWPFLRDRRIDAYQDLLRRFID